MIRGIIFDCFGVLHLDANAAYFLQFPEQQDAMHSLDVRADHGFIDKETYLLEASKLIGKTPREILAGILTQSALNKPLTEYIRTTLHPRYKIGLLSNIGHGWIHDFFDKNQLHDIFDAVILSHEEGITKPNPLIFERAAERLGISPSECIVIDDRQDNCDGAVKAGMQSIRFTTNNELIQKLTELLRKGEKYENQDY